MEWIFGIIAAIFKSLLKMMMDHPIERKEVYRDAKSDSSADNVFDDSDF